MSPQALGSRALVQALEAVDRETIIPLRESVKNERSDIWKA